MHRQIQSQFLGKRHIAFVADFHEVGHGRVITWTLHAKQAPGHISEAWIGTSWIVEFTASGTRDGKPFQATQLFLTSLRTTPEALLHLVRDRRSFRAGNGSGTPNSMKTPTATEVIAQGQWPYLLRLAGFRSIRTGLPAVMHDITALLAMAWLQPEPGLK